MIPPDRLYLDIGSQLSGYYNPPRRCVITTQWATKPERGGPRNVAVRYLDDDSQAVVPFGRRLRRATEAPALNSGGRPKGSRSAGQYLQGHGTRAAHRRHVKYSEPLCDQCRAWEDAVTLGQADRARDRAAGGAAIRDEVRFADPVWRAEFRGFFAADGWIGVTKSGPGLYYATAAIMLRDDDRLLLEAVAEVIGGNVWAQDQTARKPTLTWRTRSPGTVGRICDLLEESTLPFAKARYVPLVREFLGIVGVQGEAARDQRRRLHEALRIAHTYGGDASPLGIQPPAVEFCVCTHRRGRHFHPKRVNPYGCSACSCTRFQSADQATQLTTATGEDQAP